jgi:hypothetical protein
MSQSWISNGSSCNIVILVADIIKGVLFQNEENFPILNNNKLLLLLI